MLPVLVRLGLEVAGPLVMSEFTTAFTVVFLLNSFLVIFTVLLELFFVILAIFCIGPAFYPSHSSALLA